MKTLLSILVICYTCLGFAQNPTYSRFVGTVQFDGFVADTTAGGHYAGALASFSDQTNLYFASDIQVGDVAWDNLGNRWEVVAIPSSNITSAQVNLRALNSPTPAAPFGVGFVCRESTTIGLSAFPPDNATGISQQLKSRVETHNTEVIEKNIARLDSLNNWPYSYSLPNGEPSVAAGDTSLIAYIGDGSGYNSEFLSLSALGAGGGGIGGSGSPGSIPLFSTNFVLADSYLSQDTAEGTVELDPGTALKGHTTIQNLNASSSPIVALGSFPSNGAISVALPDNQVFTGGSTNQLNVSFTVAVSTNILLYEFHVHIRMFSTPSLSSGTFAYVVGNERFEGNFRAAVDAGRVKVWLGELDQTWFGTNDLLVAVTDVLVSQNGAAFPRFANEITQGWDISIENTAFPAVQYNFPLFHQASRLLGFNATSSDISEEYIPLFYAEGIGTDSGAVEITLPSAGETGFSGQYDFRIDAIIALSSHGRPKKFSITGKYDYTSNQFLDGWVSWEGGPPANTPVRFGDDNANPKIWIGEIGQEWTNTYIGLSNLVTLGGAANNLSKHDPFLSATWDVSFENTAFDEVSITYPSAELGEIALVGTHNNTYSGSSPGGSIISSGNTASRGAHRDGKIRYNTDTGRYEASSQSTWVSFRAYEYTPSGTADPAGAIGDTAYDSNFQYVKTSIGWLRSPLSAF